MLRLKELRSEAEKTQTEIATLIGVSRQVYANYENEINQPSIEVLNLLANIYDCSVDFLIGRSDDLGNITNSPTLSSKERELLSIFKAVESEYQSQILEYALYIAERRGIKKKNI